MKRRIQHEFIRLLGGIGNLRGRVDIDTIQQLPLCSKRKFGPKSGQQAASSSHYPCWRVGFRIEKTRGNHV